MRIVKILLIPVLLLILLIGPISLPIRFGIPDQIVPAWLSPESNLLQQSSCQMNKKREHNVQNSFSSSF